MHNTDEIYTYTSRIRDNKESCIFSLCRASIMGSSNFGSLEGPLYLRHITQKQTRNGRKKVAEGPDVNVD